MWGRKDHFDTEVQTEPDKGPKAAGQTLSPAKGRVIIELQAVRQAQSLPGGEDVAEERGHSFIGTEGLLQGVGFRIDRVKGKDLGPTGQVPCCPVEGVQDCVGRGGGLRIVGGRRCRGSLEQACRVQPALDGGQGGDRLEQVLLANFLLYGPRPAQPHPPGFQAAAHPQDEGAGSTVIGVRRVPGTTRPRFEALPTAVRKALLAVEQPGTTAGNVLQNLVGLPSLEKQPDGFAAPGQSLSVLIVHTPSLKGSMDSKGVHDVVRHL